MHRSRIAQTCGKLLAAGAVLPFLVAVVTHAVGRPARPITTSEARAGLTFDQYLVDLGETHPSEQVSARFRFTNTGEVPVTLKKLEPSCGCLTPELRKKVIEPGESSDLMMRVQTASQEIGPKEYRLTVNYEDAKPRQAHLVFRVILPDNQVTIRPRALVFYQLGEGTTSQELVVTDRRTQPLEILGASCRSELANVEVLESDQDEHGHRRLRVKVTVAGSVPPGRRQDVVTVFTNDQTYPQLKVPLIIEGAFSRMADRRSSQTPRPAKAN